MIIEVTANDLVVYIETVENGRQAKYSIMQVAPVLLITEIYLPACDGCELVVYVKKNEPKIIIVAITDADNYALKNEHSLELARGLGANFAFDKQQACQEIRQLISELDA